MTVLSFTPFCIPQTANRGDYNEHASPSLRVHVLLVGNQAQYRGRFLDYCDGSHPVSRAHRLAGGGNHLIHLPPLLKGPRFGWALSLFH